MNHNSFLLKGWAVTLVVALFAIDISKENANFLKLSFLPVFMFWVLDGYFLYQERLFRNLYDDVRVKREDEIDFSMKRESSICKYFGALFSKTIFLFYGILTVIITCILNRGRF
jgi:hypothetical protein